MSADKLKFDLDAFNKASGKAIQKGHRALRKKRKKYDRSQCIDESATLDDQHLKS